MVHLTPSEHALLAGETGNDGTRMAMEIVAGAARMLGAGALVEVVSSHIDGCLYHGDSGVLFCERLAEGGARVAVPSTTNVGALNLLNPDQVRVPPERRQMAFRLMEAHSRMGCRPSWTCAPYQAGARPGLGQQIAWGESNAVAFANTVLGARTNRYGDFLDIACAIAGRAPLYGLHTDAARRGRLVIDVSAVGTRLRREDAFYPVLGALVGRLAGESVPVVFGLSQSAPKEDQLKALCAGAASTGAAALIHIVGITPEAPDLDTALGGEAAEETVHVTPAMIADTRDSLSQTNSDAVDCVALGSPHFSVDECREVLRLLNGRRSARTIYICTGRHVMDVLAKDGTDAALSALGVEFVVDTCVVVTPILSREGGAMMTNSAKFAHYAKGNTGHDPLFGSLSECIESGVTGRLVRDGALWT
jgi:predicted aconitase